MKTPRNQFLVFLAFQLLSVHIAPAHPASGIVADAQGQVFFIHTGRGVGKVDTQGKFSYVHRSRGGHWLCLDELGSFSRTQPKYFERITPEGIKPALIFADGGSPISVVGGNLFYVSNDEALTPGGQQLTRNSPGGEVAVFAPELRRITEALGITGLAAGPNGVVYVACPGALFKVKPDGSFTMLTDKIELRDCDVDYPDNNPSNHLPYLRGLAVDEQGMVFAAGTACHCVVRITSEGKAETLLKVERPWSPTGVAERNGDLYILEYTNATGGANEGWLPRVRIRAKDGKVKTLVTIDAEGNATVTK